MHKVAGDYFASNGEREQNHGKLKVIPIRCSEMTSCESQESSQS